MRLVYKKDVLKQIMLNLGLDSIFPTSDNLRNQIIAEYLRHTLYALTHTPDGIKPVYVTRLINQVRRQLGLLWPEVLQDETENIVRQVLDHLELVRDVIELDNGYWLPTPLRPIPLSSCEQILLVGGVTTKSLQTHFGKQVKPAGLVRSIKSGQQIEKKIEYLQLEWQSFEDWLGEADNEDISIWIKTLLKQVKKQLKPSSDNLTNFEVYKPSSRENWQKRRWIPVVNCRSSLPSEIVLCHFKQLPYYRLGVLSTENPRRLQREVNLGSIEQSKLLYGLDAFYAHATYAEFEQTEFETYTEKLIFRNRLPLVQRRLLSALGHDISKKPGKLPLIYVFPKIFKTIIHNKIKTLGIEIRGDNYEY